MVVLFAGWFVLWISMCHYPSILIARVRSGLLMGDVALGMKSASGAMNACIISAACESRYFKSLHGDVLFYTV